MEQSLKSREKIIQEKISILWIVVMFNMIFADILSFMLPGFLNDILASNAPLEVTETILLVFALVLEVPIAMIFLSRVLKPNVNRWANIVASVITMAFVIGGGSLMLHYIFFASIEVIAMLFIIRYAWKLGQV